MIRVNEYTSNSLFRKENSLIVLDLEASCYNGYYPLILINELKLKLKLISFTHSLIKDCILGLPGALILSDG